MTDTAVDPQAEVRKLQDLVKKLERQNEVLRSRQNLTETDPPQVDSSSKLSDKNQDKSLLKDDNNHRINSKKNTSLEEVDVIDLEKVFRDEDEDSWLYTSPKRPSPQDRNVSPYKWMRHVFDHPSPEVESARRSLVGRLEELARSSRSPFGSPGRCSSNSSPVVNGGGSIPNIKQPLIGSRIDTGTFTRPKKTRDSTDGKESGLKSSMVTEGQEDQHKIDVHDIQELARLQEESLRQSFSPLTSPRRTAKVKAGPVPPLSLSDAENSSPLSSNRSSPGRFEGDPPLRRLSNGVQSTGSLSSGSSPPDSPYGSQYLETQKEPHRRSLPNLSKGTSNLKSPTSATGSETFRVQAPQVQRPSGMKEPVNHSPTYRPTSPAVSGLRQPAKRPVSPAGSGIPGPKTGIPRPGRTGIPSPRRNNYGMTAAGRSGSKNSIDSDESWKEGCY
ncbi:SLAIN motif-containing protein 2-like isoform X2 [Lingula anatina]|uniref:SLAIN motif-containing protein 2-like isoform X2 n=1 Tax=Lingula anatina TaxID=7574 RepID=A0A1S3HL51_LINAN|nr:SLAIN motif-containing protein 2-like isoform X2 [Lingula anatina]|eukprot:XP_013386835.1 SLAIN motif-containing protein 2-like isoform X2 [Lingula anatina]